MASDYVDQVAGSIIRQLKEGTAPWQKPWQPGERFMPYNPTTGNEYRGMNAVWLMSRAESQGFGDARWMTFRQAQEQDAHVRKGEKGTAIQFWKWQGLEPVRDGSGKSVVDQDGQPVRQMVRYERPRVWSAVVFNAEQIEGLPPAPVRPVLAEWERHERAETILTNSGASIRHAPGDRAFYRLAEDAITLPERSQFPSGDRYYATALHELGHWTGHPSRLARDLAHPFGSEGYAREELRAEIGSLMLGEQLGIGHDPGQHVAYVASWIKALEQDPREIFRAAADAEKISKLIRSYELGQEQDRSNTQDAGSQQGETMPTDAASRLPTMVRDTSPAAQPPGSERTYLAVPYAEKDDAKQLGGEVGSRRKDLVCAGRGGPRRLYAMAAGEGVRPHRRGRQPGGAVLPKPSASAGFSSMGRRRWTASFIALPWKATRPASAAAPTRRISTAARPGSSRTTRQACGGTGRPAGRLPRSAPRTGRRWQPRRRRSGTTGRVSASSRRSALPSR